MKDSKDKLLEDSYHINKEYGDDEQKEEIQFTKHEYYMAMMKRLFPTIKCMGSRHDMNSEEACKISRTAGEQAPVILLDETLEYIKEQAEAGHYQVTLNFKNYDEMKLSLFWTESTIDSCNIVELTQSLEALGYHTHIIYQASKLIVRWG